MRVSRLVPSTTPSGPREADESDIPALTALINEAYGPAEGFLYEGLRITTAEVRQKLELGSFLIEEGVEDALGGCVHVAVTGDSGYFGLLAVSPARQKSGMGRSLVAAAESFCRAKGCQTMTLDVVNRRPELVTFYARLGYEVVGERPFDDERLNRPAHFVIMRKTLQT